MMVRHRTRQALDSRAPRARAALHAASHSGLACIARRSYNQPMTTAAKKLLEDALALPERERRELGEALLDSLEEPTGEVEATWRTEVLRRVDEIQSGAAVTESWSEVKRHIREAGQR